MPKAYRKTYASENKKGHIVSSMNWCARHFQAINGQLFSDELVNSEGTHVTLYAKRDVSFDEIKSFEKAVRSSRDVVCFSVTIIPDQWFDLVEWPAPRSNEKLIFEGRPSELVARAKELPPSESIAFQNQCLIAHAEDSIAPYLAVDFAHCVQPEKRNDAINALTDDILNRMGSDQQRCMWQNIRAGYMAETESTDTSGSADPLAGSNPAPAPGLSG